MPFSTLFQHLQIYIFLLYKNHISVFLIFLSLYFSLNFEFWLLFLWPHNLYFRALAATAHFFFKANDFVGYNIFLQNPCRAFLPLEGFFLSFGFSVLWILSFYGFFLYNFYFSVWIWIDNWSWRKKSKKESYSKLTISTFGFWRHN